MGWEAPTPPHSTQPTRGVCVEVLASLQLLERKRLIR